MHIGLKPNEQSPVTLYDKVCHDIVLVLVIA